MAVPRSRISNARKNSKRSHHAKAAVNFMKCSNCQKPKLPHRICDSCGHYKGKAITAKEEEK